ncbi:MAG: hypothetical protein KAI17_09355 [Thiotrichaceae bacterium]|nr:hypothetical protein [Thiotrichaceae bacterium]
MFIEYTFSMDEGKVLSYKVEFDRTRERILDKNLYPIWTQLDFHQCPNCPLNRTEYSHCPVAIDAHDIVLGFAEVLSCKEADIRVRTVEREYFKHTDVQTGLRALIGFVMATSACPILRPLRGMAYYHLPFASLDEIVFRVASAYLLHQYYLHQKGETVDLEFEGLKENFKTLQTLNYHFSDRVRAACDADANLNVLATLFTISSMLSLSLDKHLKKIEYLFD